MMVGAPATILDFTESTGTGQKSDHILPLFEIPRHCGGGYCRPGCNSLICLKCYKRHQVCPICKVGLPPWNLYCCRLTNAVYQEGRHEPSGVFPYPKNVTPYQMTTEEVAAMEMPPEARVENPVGLFDASQDWFFQAEQVEQAEDTDTSTHNAY